MQAKLVIATHNPGKFHEMSQLLAAVPVELGLLGAGVAAIDETGATFAENAAIKASGYAPATGCFALADDSGLEVDALDGRPGLLSARYGGDIPFDQKIALLLDEMQKADDRSRGAQFVCSLAFAAPDGELIRTAEGICRGRIALSSTGEGGFGYDPVFIPEGQDRSFAELSEGEKSKISHRGRAFCEIIPFLRDFFAKLT